MSFNLTDAVIQGNDESIKRMDLVKSNYQLRANIDALKGDAFLSCKTKKFGSSCKKVLDSLSKAINNMKKWSMSRYKSMGKRQKKVVTDLIEKMDTILKNKDKDEINFFLNTYHTKYI